MGKWKSDSIRNREELDLAPKDEEAPPGSALGAAADFPLM